MMDRLKQNPYESPSTDDLVASQHAATTDSRHCVFFAWYFGAFILSALMWHLSAHLRAFDFIEIPMASFHFPLAGFLDPHDGMVRNHNVFYYAVVFWGAVCLVALRFAPLRFGQLLTALGIIVACSAASIIYAIAYHLLGLGQMI